MADATATVPSGVWNLLIRRARPTLTILGRPGDRVVASDGVAVVGEFVADRPLRLARAAVVGHPTGGSAPWRLYVRAGELALAAGELAPDATAATLAPADLVVPAGAVVQCGVEGAPGAWALDAPSFTLTWLDAE